MDETEEHFGLISDVGMEQIDTLSNLHKKTFSNKMIFFQMLPIPSSFFNTRWQNAHKKQGVGNLADIRHNTVSYARVQP